MTTDPAFRKMIAMKFFSRVGGWRAAHPDGTGMGLAIVKKIIDHYNGQVRADPRASKRDRDDVLNAKGYEPA